MNVVHGDWNFGFNGSLTGSWTNNWLSNISGSFTSNNNNVTINVNSGYLHTSGWGILFVYVERGNKNYWGAFNFKSIGWYGGFYNNTASQSDIKLWGGADLQCQKDNGKSCNSKWVGLDLWGPGTDTVEVPEPASLGLMGLGLLGFAAARRRKDSI